MDREEALKAISRIYDRLVPELQEALAVLVPDIEENEDTFVEGLRNLFHDYAIRVGGKITAGNAMERSLIRDLLHRYASIFRRQDLQQRRADAHNTLEQRSDVGTAGNYRFEASAKD